MEITEEKKIGQVASNFGRSAQNYHQEARVQRKVAEGLLSSLLPWRSMLPNGPILEIGCGTGFLTKLLLENFPKKKFLITDASPNMLRFCKQQLEQEDLLTEQVQFKVLDANEFTETQEQYAMVISNFVPQWFKDTPMVLENLSKSILPGGLLLCSFPGNNSFEQWYQNCLKLGLPYTANPLPDVEEVVIKLSMGPMQIDYYENDLFDEFDSALDFFKHLKNIGASESVNQKSLNYKQFKLLVNHWDKQAGEKIKLKWHVVYLAAKKDL